MPYIIKDRYEPKTGYTVGEFIQITEGHYRLRTGEVVGFGNPTFTRTPAIRVQFATHTYPVTFPVSRIRKLAN